MKECRAGWIKLCWLAVLWLLALPAGAANIAYIHGDVSECGVTPAAADVDCESSPYDQMLLNDNGSRGLSEFVAMVNQEGHSIAQFYDQQTELNEAWLADKDVVIFGLHQKLWSAAEKIALDVWLRAGGGMFIYSDSASGGCFCEVGAQNPVGQQVTNNLIANYQMQVTVDQADGTTGQQSSAATSIPGVAGLTLEGEGVSPVAIAAGNSSVEILIPYNRAVNKRQGLSITNPVFAALALAVVGDGHIVVMFDRQPMWNNGPGSDINEQDNRAILRSVINYLALRPEPPIDPPSKPGEPQPLTAAVMALLALLLEDDS